MQIKKVTKARYINKIKKKIHIKRVYSKKNIIQASIRKENRLCMNIKLASALAFTKFMKT